MRCTLVTADGTSLQIAVNVTSVVGSTVNFGMKTV
jgi:hypothetical protein